MSTVPTITIHNSIVVLLVVLPPVLGSSLYVDSFLSEYTWDLIKDFFNDEKGDCCNALTKFNVFLTLRFHGCLQDGVKRILVVFGVLFLTRWRKKNSGSIPINLSKWLLAKGRSCPMFYSYLFFNVVEGFRWRFQNSDGEIVNLGNN